MWDKIYDYKVASSVLFLITYFSFVQHGKHDTNTLCSKRTLILLGYFCCLLFREEKKKKDISELKDSELTVIVRRYTKLYTDRLKSQVFKKQIRQEKLPVKILANLELTGKATDLAKASPPSVPHSCSAVNISPDTNFIVRSCSKQWQGEKSCSNWSYKSWVTGTFLWNKAFWWPVIPLQ